MSLLPLIFSRNSIIAFLCALLVFGYIAFQWQGRRLDNAKHALEQAQYELVQTKEVLEKAQQDHTKALAAIKAQNDQALKRAESTRTIIKEIHNAPATDDAPVAPVLERTLDRLRARQN